MSRGPSSAGASRIGSKNARSSSGGMTWLPLPLPRGVVVVIVHRVLVPAPLGPGVLKELPVSHGGEGDEDCQEDIGRQRDAPDQGNLRHPVQVSDGEGVGDVCDAENDRDAEGKDQSIPWGDEVE